MAPQFCEDIGANASARLCRPRQNADNQGGTGQRGLPLDEMPAYIQDVLNLIEWANGPTNSTWGAKRAVAGHPESFHLQYLGVGNEEHLTPVFEERFKMINDVLRLKNPEITVIGTVGPFLMAKIMMRLKSPTARAARNGGRALLRIAGVVSLSLDALRRLRPREIKVYLEANTPLHEKNQRHLPGGRHWRKPPI